MTMNCPYCNEEMKKGIIAGDGRTPIAWEEENSGKNAFEKFTDKWFAGIGRLRAVKYTVGKFSIDAFYCPKCKKLIIDTDISE
ncbi:MAG: hypothetical protein IJ446_04765 [Oscillospiraceae bacterium]|nr:hypothetical protein [Oscillospiraceae bacterium]